MRSSWEFSGWGKAFYENGEVYEGEYQNGKRHGYGEYFYLNGYVYKGNWVENIKEG